MGQKLTSRNKFIYAIGQMGWSALINIVNLQLVYFYIPTTDSNIPEYIPQITLLLVFNTVALLAASGRLFDAITDPLIAMWSDNHTGSSGRRTPFMKYGALPAAICCCLLFVPIVDTVSYWNVLWLFLIQIGFYFSLTVYVTPYFALLPEMGRTNEDRLSLSLWISITYALGMVLASQVPALASVFEGLEPQLAIRYAVMILGFLSFLAMLVPAFFLNEKSVVHQYQKQPKLTIWETLSITFRNRHFKYYVVADFAYFCGLTITLTGFLYYITVLLELEETASTSLLPLIVVLSFVIYPFVSRLAHTFGKKLLVVIAFFWLVAVFGLIYFLGNLPLSAWNQAYILVVLMSIPIAFLGVLPNAILGDIAVHSARSTGVNNEGMYFAARTLLQKFGQTFGIILFASLTLLGKDIGNDFGIRMSGVVGALLCAIAGIYFLGYDESKVLEYE